MFLPSEEKSKPLARLDLSYRNLKEPFHIGQQVKPLAIGSGYLIEAAGFNTSYIAQRRKPMAIGLCAFD